MDHTDVLMKEVVRNGVMEKVGYLHIPTPQNNKTKHWHFETYICRADHLDRELSEAFPSSTFDSVHIGVAVLAVLLSGSHCHVFFIYLFPISKYAFLP